MELKITIELNEEETTAILTLLRGFVRVIAPTATSSETEAETQAIEASEPSDMESVGEELLEPHDCLEFVEFDVIEDEDGVYTAVNCEVCGEDVSEAYEQTYGDDDCDDDYFDAMRELFGGNGDD